jgi:hypothetical protein
VTDIGHIRDLEQQGLLDAAAKGLFLATIAKI